MNNYLTESTLGSSLKEIFKNSIWIHDKTFIGRTRPDFRCEELKMIVEFDGYQHFTSASRILKDKEKDIEEQKLKYTVIRIPYFVQLSSLSIKKLFNIEINWNQIYPHGFVDSKCILPADFCELGIKKFTDFLDDNEWIKSDVIKSLKDKSKTLNILEVLPQSLLYLIK